MKSRWACTSSRISSSISVPICFCITSFFCLIRWIRTKHSSDCFSNAPPFFPSSPFFRSSYILQLIYHFNPTTHIFPLRPAAAATHAAAILMA